MLRLTARRLDQALAGRVLERVDLRWPGVDESRLLGDRVREVDAYGKHLFVRSEAGLTLHTHLRMDGSWRIAATGSPGARARGAGVRAVLGTSRWTAVGDQLGMLDLLRTRDEHRIVGRLGPDVLDESFDPEQARERFTVTARDRATPIAEALLDQTRVAGIGTLFTAEGLFARAIWPWTPVGEVGDDELTGLLATVHAQMDRSVRAGLRQRVVRVHARAGLPCVRCAHAIAVGPARRPPYERPIYYCPRCQSPSQPTG